MDNSNEWNKGNPSSPATIEPIINAWPMDEQYIDTYMTNNSSPTAYTSSSLFNANGGSATCTPACTDSAKNISVGWHSVEFLLWGSDVSTTGPGPGSSSDFAATSGTCTTT
ncbi:MAG: hypothetical protein K8R21_00010, partial [Leptospira sp.]|nr:hypothetical protein [Leptospira sp.]